MKKYAFVLAGALLLAALIIPSAAVAQTQQGPSWNHRATVYFERPVEIPGRLLPPGTYVLKLIVPENHVAQILSQDESRIYGVFFTKTAERATYAPLPANVKLEPRENASLKWDRLIAWFSNEEPIGDEVSYDQHQPVDPTSAPQPHSN